jgi:hypothetical protein
MLICYCGELLEIVIKLDKVILIRPGWLDESKSNLENWYKKNMTWLKNFQDDICFVNIEV